MRAQSVRKMCTDDLAEVFRLGRGMLSPAEGLPAWEPEPIAEALCSDPGLAFVCLEKKKITGFLIASRCAEGVQILWMCAEKNSKDTKDNLMLAFYQEAVLRDISLVTVLARSDPDGNADYFRERGFSEENSHTVARLVLTDIPRRAGTGEKP